VGSPHRDGSGVSGGGAAQIIPPLPGRIAFGTKIPRLRQERISGTMPIRTPRYGRSEFCATLAERVIRATDRQHPADAVLREVIRAERDLTPDQRTRVSSMVFTYFRWRGWLEPAQSLKAQLELATSLAERYATQPDRFTDKELLAHAVPSWLPTVMEVSPEWLRALQAQPKLWLRARAGHGHALAAKLGDCRPFGPGALGDTLEYGGEQDLFRTAEFHAGEFELQDLSSQAVGFICAPQPGQTWWDVCAGEGGKMLHLSGLMGNKGLIWASDPAAWRLQKLKRRAARAEVFNYRTVSWDGGPRLPTKTKFDGVLVDAPCSGIGTWQRNPHARWSLSTNDVEELSQLQRRLLVTVASAVKPGGTLIYAVCTLTRAETQQAVEAFEAQCAEFTRRHISDPLRPGSPASAHVEYWPQQFGGSGMFVATWTRRAG
jgi:16S rRNA (cytosine967-C5)-methyltransferase